MAHGTPHAVAFVLRLRFGCLTLCVCRQTQEALAKVRSRAYNTVSSGQAEAGLRDANLKGTGVMSAVNSSASACRLAASKQGLFRTSHLRLCKQDVCLLGKLSSSPIQYTINQIPL